MSFTEKGWLVLAFGFNIWLSVRKRLTRSSEESWRLSLKWLTLFLKTWTSYGYCLLFIFFCWHDTQHMTSLEIAEVTGKSHNHLMRDIRNMEKAWEKIAQSKLGLSTYKDPRGGRVRRTSLPFHACSFRAQWRGAVWCMAKEGQHNRNSIPPSSFRWRNSKW